MNLATVGQALGTFAVTNVDDLVVLAVFFGQARGDRGAAVRIVAGQYLGFLAIIGASLAGAAVGSTLLPAKVLPYFGLLPIALGLRAAWIALHQRRGQPDQPADDAVAGRQGPRTWHVAAVTLANGGDNIGVYLPIFVVATAATISVFTAVFLLGVGIWCAAGRYFASHRVIAKLLARWGHIVLPVALISVGVAILLSG